MMPHAIWSEEAESDLENVAFYIAMQDARPATADRILREVRQLVDLIATQPEMGQARPEFGASCRAISYKHR
jgi:plasmid stabilization system protein ParE